MFVDGQMDGLTEFEDKARILLEFTILHRESRIPLYM